MDKSKALISEYNNLWQEKIIHKQSIRKFHYYITYLSIIGSLALTFVGISPTDIFKEPKYFINPIDIATLIVIPLPITILIILSFAINDLSHIYTIGNQIGVIEKKINYIYGIYPLLSWEHRICPILYGGAKTNDNIKPMSNIILWNDIFILIPFVFIVCLSSLILGIYFVYNKLILLNKYFISIYGIIFHLKWNFWLALLYASLNIYFIIFILIIALKLFSYIKPDGKLKHNINELNKMNE